MNQKKGDIMDGILYAEKLAHEKSSYPEHFSKYPERVIDTLVLFYSIWKLPIFAIPKKKSPKFSQWILELDELNLICGSKKNMKRAMELALEKYNASLNKFIVSHPLAIRKLLIDAVGEINRNTEKEDVTKEKEVYIPKEEIGKQLRSFLEEE